MHNKQISLILLGKTGSGKSASGNTILNRKAFASKTSAKSTTTSMKCGNVTIGEVSFKVYDTPGLFDTERRNEAVVDQWNKDLPLEESVPTVFLLVIRADRFTEEGIKTVKDIEEFLGEGHIKNTWILFTRGDELEIEDITIDEFIDETEELKCIVRKRFEGRYHIFNNKAMGNREQVTQLTAKIQERYCITGPVSEPSSSLHQPSVLPERRLVLLGKTGVGKSATGNTILGGNIFHSERSSRSITCASELKESDVAGRQVSVVDTPGLFDTDFPMEKLAVEFGRSIYLSPKGLHAFLIVLRAERYTKHEKEVIQLITALYGQKALKYAMILFTGGDQLEGKTIEKFIEDNSDLSELVRQCGGRYHVFNNKDNSNREQVTTLLEKVDIMVEENGGGCYTNEMFKDAVRLQVEEQMVKCINERREEEERIRKQQEEQDEKLEEIERVKRETEERVRKEYEEKREEEERIRKQKEVQEKMRRVKQQREDEIRVERIMKEYEEKQAALENQPRTVSANEDLEEPGDGFWAFLKKYWGSLAIAAAIGGAVVGAAGGAIVGACLGPLGAVAGAAAGAKLGSAVGAVVGAVCGITGTYAHHTKKKTQ